MSIAANSTVQCSGVAQCRDDEPLYEIIDGQRVDLPPGSILSSRVASRLMASIGCFLIENPLGEVLGAFLVHLPLQVDRSRRPDVAFVSAQRIAQASSQPGSDDAWNIVPELMVEVVSPHNLAEEIMERLDEYWAAGTGLVWIVYSTQRLVYVYEAPRQVRILGVADQLEGGSVLPGLRIPIASLFPE